MVVHFYLYLLHYQLSLFFFFFKQKTAYEMRISDWSSDVCSSDLSRCSSNSTSPAVISRWPFPSERSVWCSLDGHGTAKSSANVPKDIARQRFWQIGRASCRERVCQYV